MRWNLGLPDTLKPHGKFRALLYLLIVIDMVLTPILFPIVGYAFYRDQRKVQFYLLPEFRDLNLQIMLFLLYV